MSSNFLQVIKGYKGTEERELFRKRHLHVLNCVFNGPGESPLKECVDVLVTSSRFNARYAGWEDKNITFKDCHLTRLCRAPFWYTKNLVIEDCHITSPKCFRELDDVTIKNSYISGIEAIWQVRNFKVDNLNFTSYYPFLECSNGTIKNLTLKGKYSFQHCHDITIENSVLDTKDAFWHSENITIKNSLVKGEYVAWYAKDITFINCRIEGTQPFIGSKNLRFENCDFANDTDRAFEDTTASGSLIHPPFSIYNPKDISFTYKEGDEPPVDIDKRNCRYSLTKID